MKRYSKKNKYTPLIILAAVAVVLLVGSVLLYLWQTKWNRDPKPPVVDTDTSAFSESFFGTWHVEHGKADHSLSILPNGYAVYKNGTQVDTVRYSSEETDKITAWIDGYIYDFELDGDTLVRYRKGKPDGYIYHQHES